jgi:hypothetical protein
MANNSLSVYPPDGSHLIPVNATYQDVVGPLTALGRQNLRVFILFMRPEHVRVVMDVAYDLDLFGANYVYLVSDATGNLPPQSVFDDDRVLAVANGALAVQAGTDGVDREDFEQQDFRIEYESMFGSLPGPLSALFYDAVWSVVLGIAKVRAAGVCGAAVRGQALADAILSREFSGASGTVSFVGNSLAEPSLLLGNLVGLKYRTVATLQADQVLFSDTPILWPGFEPTPPALRAIPIAVISYRGFPKGNYSIDGVKMALRDLMLDNNDGLLRGDTLILPPSNVVDEFCTEDSGRNAFLRLMNGPAEQLPAVIIGPLCSASAKGYISLAADRQIPNLAFDATDMAFNDRSAYPYFARLHPSNSQEIDSMLAIVQFFGFQRVAVLGTTDDFSDSGASRLRILSAALGIDTYPVPRWQRNAPISTIRDRLSNAVRDGVRVFMAYVQVLTSASCGASIFVPNKCVLLGRHFALDSVRTARPPRVRPGVRAHHQSRCGGPRGLRSRSVPCVRRHALPASRASKRLSARKLLSAIHIRSAEFQ